MSLAGVGAASAIGGGLFSALGASNTASQTALSDQEQAQSAIFNQEVSLRNAKYTREATALEVQQEQRDNEAQLGTIRNTYGASGLDMAGSTLDVLRGTARAGAYAQGLTGWQGAITAQQYRDQAQVYGQQSAVDMQNASEASSSGFLGVLGSIFGAGTALSNNSAVRGAFGIGK